MTTKWDDKRLTARVEARTDDGRPGQRDIDNAQGYVVRLYDHGPLDGRLAEPSLVYDSEVSEGSVGIFGSEDEAAGFRDRRLAVQLSACRAIETMRADREHALPELTNECVIARAKAKREASEANARGKAALERQDTLAEEARNPVVTITCPPRGSGWTVSAAPCVTEGLDGEPRQIAQLLPDAAKLPPKRKKKSKRTPKEVPPSIEASLDATLAASPSRVPDCNGKEIGVGSRVLHVGENFYAEVTQIRHQDKSGAWWVEIEDAPGQPRDCLATELERQERDDDWPEEAA